ncbi:glycosyltransferase [Nisaea denitrificans]|uniref:glycosyltransferase n=1 Tax=Nisaea denitrificans TaxID=390877 RepID=UPI00048B3C73|nr:glycosyltransferase [Nisaea denitrificans]
MVQIVYATVKNLDQPIGGVIVQAAHVASLRRAGFDAKIASSYEGGLPPWVDQDAVFENSNQLAIGPGDILVLHDSLPRHTFDRVMSMPVRRVFFCQNHYFLGGTLQPHERLSDFPIDAFLCVSEPIAAHLRDAHGVADPFVIRPAIRPAIGPADEKKIQVCYMPRKRMIEFGSVMYGLRYLYPHIAGTPFVSIHNRHPNDVAAIMAESAVFLSLSRNEGLGLPPLEAMAAGCVVVGYHGGGGLDYATAANGRWYDEATPDNLVHLLAETILSLRADPNAFSGLVEAGRQTVAGYTDQAMDDALLDFWRSFL